MVDEDSDDEIIRERAFRISDKLDLGDLVDESRFTKDIVISKIDEQEDEAIGDVFDPFVQSKSLGDIEEDGSVKSAPETDLITDISTDGERGVNWVLMGSMILVYSAIGIQIGLVFEPLTASISLMLLAGFGFFLGERWSNDIRLRILGITWIIISMKVLYGLAIELQRWGIIGVEGLGILLLLVVGLNIAVSYRHDHDAIAAQSTLVLLAVGSTAGSLFGQEGVALMILLSTMLMHMLATHRKSGNLAALGIASSNLWIGMHAITGGFEIGELKVLSLDRPLLLFVLVMVTTSLNAGMATRFAREENWFSKAMKVLGLGKPGLWGVSVSLGLMGALLAVAANRGDIGYALGMVTVLGGAFSGSYLVVRGVTSRRVIVPLASMAVFLLLLLIYGESFSSSLELSEYTIFTVIGCITVAFVILRDQDSVTDRVLWMGTVVILALLIILVPAKSPGSGGDGGIILLGMLSLLHIGSATLAVKRKSPSLAGVTVLLPWTWIILEQTIEETLRTLLVSNNFEDLGSIIHLEPFPLAFYLSVCSLMMMIVNERMGEANVNLASKFLGISEISASIRDSGAIQLWSLGLWLPMISIVFMAQFGAFTSPTLLVVTGLLWGLHVFAHARGVRIGKINLMIGIILISGMMIQWRHGLGEYFSLIICMVLASILLIGREDDDLFTISMGAMGVPLLFLIPDRSVIVELEGVSSLPSIDPSMAAIFCTGLILSIYLPKAGQIEDLLKPALSSLWLMSICIGITYVKGDSLSLALSIGLFVVATIWLVGKGELRREIQTITRVSERRALASDRSVQAEDESQVRTYDAREAEMISSRKRSREKTETDDLEELYTSDISHRPVIVIAVMILVFVASMVIGLTSGPNPIMLIAVGAFVTILIGVARYRTRQLELDLPHILGMEMPIALAISGLVVVHIFSLLGPGASNEDLSSMGILTILIVELSLISLYQQDNMLDRIPIAIDWIIYSLLFDRILGAILYESMPWPLSIDPFSGEAMEWKAPLLGLELCLLGIVLVGFWIGNLRLSKGREEEDGFTLGARSVSIVLLSSGIGAFFAVISVLYDGWRRSQPSAVGMAILGSAMTILSISNWIEGVSEIISELYILSGVILLILLISTVPLKGEKWTMTLAFNAHLLLIVGALSGGLSGLIPVILILLSTTMWATGILQLRKTLRTWGLVDLIIALLFSVTFYGGILFQPQILLFGLSVVAIELGLISWLGLRNEDELVNS
ncbi:MAG: hypothetical protein L7R66_04885 [Candidatus Thalassarchaeaceae archaeon]|nr:hypothetical protein [Candidatus Thalassarchaeaceae archaeon]